MYESKKKKRIGDGIRVPKKSRQRVNNLSCSTPDREERSISYQRPKTKKKKRFVNTELVDNNHHKNDFEPINFNQNNKTSKKSFSLFPWIKKNSRILRWLLFILLYALVLYTIFSRLEKTTITVGPRIENIKDSVSLDVYLQPKHNQLGFDMIAFSAKKEQKITPKEMKNVEQKASGTIKIFNDYSTQPQRLRAETRFKSVSGHIFKLGSKAITIPGKKDGKPGTIEAKVYAEKPGPEYNLDVTDFTIPGFKEAGLDDKYSNIYALSVDKFKGGFIGKKPYVGESQKQDSVKALQTTLKSELMNRLDAEKTNKVLLVDNSIQIFYKEPKIENEKDDMVSLTQEAQIFALLIEKKQLEKFLLNKYFKNTDSKDARLKNFENINFTYHSSDIIDFKKIKRAKIKMDLNNQVIWRVDADLLKKSLLGLNFRQALVIFKEFQEIDAAKVRVFPFWKKRISSISDDVLLNIKNQK